MKIVTVLGTRPEIIRLSRLISKLDQYCNHLLIHTGQNFENKLSDVFFEELDIRSPNRYLGVDSSSFGVQVGQILSECEKVFKEENPDVLLILGDTNSGLSAIVAKRMGIPVYHMEAGNRCFDDRVPEEINRRIIDHTSTILMPYTKRSKENLLAEGIHNSRIYVTGNPIFEVLKHHAKKIDDSDIKNSLNLKTKEYFLCTLHRAENVDIPTRLKTFANALKLLQTEYNIPIIVSTHPRTRDKLEAFDIDHNHSNIQYLEPMGFFDFVHLEKHAKCVLTDSGTVQEECCIIKTPAVTLRDVTERPETIECGSNILSGCEPKKIKDCVDMSIQSGCNWDPPSEYLTEDVSSTVLKIVEGFLLDIKQIKP